MAFIMKKKKVRKMNKLKSLSLVSGTIIAVLILALSGCGTQSPAVTTTTTGGASPNAPSSGVAAIGTNSSSQGTGIWVTGQGVVYAVPDVANLLMGVQVQAKTVSDALSQAAQAMNAVIGALKGKGVADQDIQTQGYNISPVYGQGVITVPPVTVYPPTAPQPTAAPGVPTITLPGQPIIVGYQVTNTASITVRNLANAGAIIDAGAQAGGDSIRIQSIYFSISDPSKYYSQARTLAVNDAKAKAQQLASASGVTLGSITYIAENQGYTPPIYASGAAVPGATTPISPGQPQIIISVQMAFAIQ